MAKNLSAAPVGIGLIVASSLFYASYGIWTTLLGNYFGGYIASTFRSILVLLILVPIAIKYRQLDTVHWRRDWKYFAGLLVSSLLVWGPLYFAIIRDGIATASTINYVTLLLGMFLFGRLLAGERFTKDKLLATGLGIIGLGLVFSPSLGNLGWVALGAAGISGLSNAASSVITQQMPYNATQSIVIAWAASIVSNLFMIPIAGERLPVLAWHVQWLYLVILAVTSVFASWSLIAGLKIIEAGVAGILGLLEIVFSILFGLIFFRERVSPLMTLGAITIISAAAIPCIKDFYAERKLKTVPVKVWVEEDESRD